MKVAGRRVDEHILIAEKALGRKLPEGVEIHHVDGNGFNNSPNNLVICPDSAYHNLLHQRQRAFDACGNYNWRKCPYCKQYDDPANLVFHKGNQPAHLTCKSAYLREYRAKHKEA